MLVTASYLTTAQASQGGRLTADVNLLGLTSAASSSRWEVTSTPTGLVIDGGLVLDRARLIGGPVVGDPALPMQSRQ
jgi:hypothetical protein